MNLRRSVSSVAITLVMVVAIAGCAKKVPPPAPPPPAPPAAPAPPPAPPPPPAPAPAPPPRPLTEDEIFAQKTVDQLNAEMPLGDVFFDLDKSDIRDDQKDTLQKNADYLRRWMSVKVRIEGNTDSRGTNEYNLALGERRANTVKQYLTTLGITEDRLEVISKGEDAPVCTDENEECWQRNRHDHFVITAK
jgi:peptidoglycan-associated lipoprotein